MEEKNKWVELLLCIFGGFFGLHYFYVGNILKGILYLCTLGLCGIGWLVDIIRIIVQIIKDNKENIIQAKENLEQNIAEQNKAKEEALLKYNRIAENVLIDKENKAVIINNVSCKFTDLMSVRLLEEETERKVFTGYAFRFNMGLAVGDKVKIIKRINVEIKTRDLNNPFINIEFLNKRSGIKTTSKKYRRKYNEAQRCVSSLELIISENNIQI